VDELIESTSLSPLKIKLKNHLMRASALLTIAYSLKEKLIELGYSDDYEETVDFNDEENN
jgi:hypothetical protein